MASPVKLLLALLDGHSLIHRAYHAIQEPLVVRKTGEEVTAVYGFTNTLLKVIEDLKPTHIAVCLDHPAPTFRHQADETYKATRVAAPPELKAQMGRVREVIHAFGIPMFEVEGYEADDVLAALARQGVQEGAEVYLVSLDSDIAQLVEPGVRLYMYRIFQRDVVIYDEEGVRGRYGVEPRQVPDLKGLKGDVSDNIPGVPGIGDKTAVRLIHEFGSVEGVLAQLGSVTPEKVRQALADHREQALHSKRMATIERDVPATLDLEACRLAGYDRERVLDLFRELEFRTLVARLPEPPVSVAAPAPSPVEERYETVSTEDALAELVRRARQQGVFAFDTETTYADALQALPVGISIALGPGEASYLPVGHRPGLGERAQLPLATVLHHLGPLFEDAAVRKVAHNGKYDMLVLANQGLSTRGLAFDTMIAAYLLGEGGGGTGARPGEGSLGLKWLASKRLGIEMTPITDLIGKGAKQLSMADVPVEAASRYACADADMTWRLWQSLEPDLKAQNLWRLFEEVEMPLVSVLTGMELVGVALDPAVLREMSGRLADQVGAVERQIYEMVGHDFNLSSPLQLSQVLFEELKLPKTRRTQSGYSTDAQSLEQLRQKLLEETGQVHPILDLLQEARHLAKLKSTYVDTLPALVSSKDGRLHTSFSQVTAATGRLSSSEPNLQNIPVRSEVGSQIRRAFVARDLGTDPWLLAADYSQIELRILAHLCKDPGLVEAFQRDEDIHAATAASVFGVPLEAVTPEMRRRAKVFNFGVLYGLSEFGLSTREGISREEAATFINTYFEKFATVQGWQERVIAETRQRGYGETILGRRRYIPEINATNYTVRRAGERMAINMPTQGTAADIIKVAMNRIDAEINERGLRGRMILQVHDELIYECPAAELDAFREISVRVMPSAVQLDLPLKVDLKVGKSWGEME